MEHSITIKDIARKFKCSPSTVSRALNDYEIINIETRKTIQEYAVRMGYQKNSVSLNLLNKSSRTIGVILPNVTHCQEAFMMEGIQKFFLKKGFLLEVSISNEQKNLETEALKKMMANRVAGVLVSVAQESFDTKSYEHFEHTINRGLPIVFIDRAANFERSGSVVNDDFQGAYMATQHLIDNGCRRIGHLAGPKGMKVAQERKRGYIECLVANNISVEDDFLVDTDFEMKGAIAATEKMLGFGIDGIFGANDNLCLGAMKVIREKGLEIPKDVAIVGFDNSPVAEYVYPSLSSVERYSEQMGSLGASILDDIIENKNASNKKEVIMPELIVRKSSVRI
jgi:LacI family transcriptional regulator